MIKPTVDRLVIAGAISRQAQAVKALTASLRGGMTEEQGELLRLILDEARTISTAAKQLKAAE